MRALMFIQKNDGEIRYKCDTFWTTSNLHHRAKIYSSDSETLINDWLISYNYNIQEYLKKHPDETDKIIEEYHLSKLGYRTVNDDLISDGGHTLKSGVEIIDLGTMNYTHEMVIDGPKVIVIDIRSRELREEKLTQILKK